MRTRRPWEVHPDLTADRLAMVGKLLAEVRGEALQEFDPARGDRAWGYGCKVYERCCARIEQAATMVDWLEIIEPPLHFVFAIGRVPIRFYHGLPESPRLNSLWRNPPELDQHQEAFAFLDQEDDGWFWRIAVVSDTEGSVVEVVVFQARDSSETRYRWSIPLDQPMSVLASLGSIPDPVELPPAEVGVPVADENVHEDAGDS